MRHASGRHGRVHIERGLLYSALQGVILLQGGGPAHVYSTDAEAVFRWAWGFCWRSCARDG
jgi:hypothetical protein